MFVFSGGVNHLYKFLQYITSSTSSYRTRNLLIIKHEEHFLVVNYSNYDGLLGSLSTFADSGHTQRPAVLEGLLATAALPNRRSPSWLPNNMGKRFNFACE